MRRITAAILLILAISVETAIAGEIREIELSDGSVITGEILSLSDGIYTIKSDSLGTLRVEEARIRAVRSKAPALSGSQSNGDASADAGSLMERMMNDGEIMTMVMGLQSDEDFQKILADPEIMEAVKNNDIATLMSKPEFIKLLNNPAIRDIEEKVK